jgi:hypothetical protein
MKEESIVYRIVGLVDGTTLVYDPPITGAPATISLGQRVDFEARSAFRLTSQDKNHPFYVAQTMTVASIASGSRPDGDPNFDFSRFKNPNVPHGLGDPDFVNVMPPAQFIKEYTFVTDPTYPTTTLTVTRAKDQAGFHDVKVDCLGTLGGWQPVGASGDYEFTRVDLVRGQKGVGSCQNGLHTASSDVPFGVTVWGVDWWSSYGYPAGGTILQLSDVTVSPK